MKKLHRNFVEALRRRVFGEERFYFGFVVYQMQTLHCRLCTLQLQSRKDVESSHAKFGVKESVRSRSHRSRLIDAIH